MRIALLSTLVLLILTQLSMGKVTFTEDDIRKALREFMEEGEKSDEDHGTKTVNGGNQDPLDVSSLDPESNDEDDAESQKVELPEGEKTPTNINPNVKEEQKEDNYDTQPPPLDEEKPGAMKSAWRRKRSADKVPDLKGRKRRIINALLKALNSESNEKDDKESNKKELPEGLKRIKLNVNFKTQQRIINKNVSPEQLKKLKEILKESIRQLNETTCVKWVKRTSEINYVRIFNDNGCYSYEGQIGGGQSLSMQAYGCMSVHTMLHEMLHAMGAKHEQSRSDRDRMMSMVWEHLPSDSLYNFQMGNTFNSQPYDYKSLMQYELDSFGGGRKSMTIPDKSLEYLISNKKVELSLYDIGEINGAYKCTAMCFNKCENGGRTIVNEEDVCGCKCPTGLKGDDCSQLDTNFYCGGFITLTAGESRKIDLDSYTPGTACTSVVKGGTNTRIKATTDSLDLPYNYHYDCYHWLEFRDNLIGDSGKERCGTQGGATFTKMVIGDPSRMMIRFDSVKHRNEPTGKGFTITVEAYVSASASTKCDFGDDFRGCVFQLNKTSSDLQLEFTTSGEYEDSGNDNGYQYLMSPWGFQEKESNSGNMGQL
uniref:Metalloendopeptidase n=1 Tax=Crassostrea virginica TaxID=6565 RepID=A0A8B8B2X9_CRAVI|nr:blastula protease 10-like [Crassostrea virginica]